MIIQMMNTNKMFSINKMLLGSIYLTINLNQINFKNLFLLVDNLVKIVVRIKNKQKKK